MFLCLDISTVQNTYFKMASKEVLIVPVMSFFLRYVSFSLLLCSKRTQNLLVWNSSNLFLTILWAELGLEPQDSLSHMSSALVLHLVPSTQPISCFSLLPNIAIGLQLCMVAGFPRAKSKCHQLSSGLSRNWYNVTSFGQSKSQSCPDSGQGEIDSSSWWVEHRSSEGGGELLADRNS